MAHRGRNKITSLERRLGFFSKRGLHRLGRSSFPKHIRTMLKDIDRLKKKYIDVSPDDLDSSVPFRQESNDLFFEIGNHAWPEVDSNTWECVDPELYPRPLQFLEEYDRLQVLQPLFFQLVLEKCKTYHRNQDAEPRRRANKAATDQARNATSAKTDADNAKDSSSHQSPTNPAIDYQTPVDIAHSPSTHDDGEDLHDSDPSYYDEDDDEQGDPTFKFPRPLSGPQLTVTPARSDLPAGVDPSQLRSQRLYSSRKRGTETDGDGNDGSTKRARRHSRDNGSPTSVQQDQQLEDTIDQPAVDPDDAEDEALEDRWRSLVVKLKLPQGMSAGHRQSDLLYRTTEFSSTWHDERDEPFSHSVQSPATIDQAEAQDVEAPLRSGVAVDDNSREESAEATVYRDAGVSASSNTDHPPSGHRSQDQNVSLTAASDSLNHNQEIHRQLLGGPAPVAVMSVDASIASPTAADFMQYPASTTTSRGALIRKGSNRIEKGKAVRRESRPCPTKQTRPDNRISAETVQALKDGIAAFRQSENILDDRRPSSTTPSSTTDRAIRGARDIIHKDAEQTAVAGPSTQRLTPTTVAQDEPGRTLDSQAATTAVDSNPTKAVSAALSMSTHSHAKPDLLALQSGSKARVQGASPRDGEETSHVIATSGTGPLSSSVALPASAEPEQYTSGAGPHVTEQTTSPGAGATPELQRQTVLISNAALSATGHTVLPEEGSTPDVPAQGAVPTVGESAAASQITAASPNPEPPAATEDAKLGSISGTAQTLHEQVQPTVEAPPSASQDAKPQAVSSNLDTGKIILVDWTLEGDDSVAIPRLTHYTQKLWNALKADMPEAFKGKKLGFPKRSKVDMSASEVLDRYGESIAANTREECVDFLMDEAFGDAAAVVRTWQKATVVMRD